MKHFLACLFAAGIVFLAGGCVFGSPNLPATTEAPAALPAEQTTLPAAEAGQNYTVMIQNFSFVPAELKIKKGDTVTWTNDDKAPHSVFSVTGYEISSEVFEQGQTYSHTFNITGTFEYNCRVHHKMIGKIIVE